MINHRYTTTDAGNGFADGPSDMGQLLLGYGQGASTIEEISLFFQESAAFLRPQELHEAAAQHAAIAQDAEALTLRAVASGLLQVVA